MQWLPARPRVRRRTARAGLWWQHRSGGVWQPAQGGKGACCTGGRAEKRPRAQLGGRWPQVKELLQRCGQEPGRDRHWGTQEGTNDRDLESSLMVGWFLSDLRNVSGHPYCHWTRPHPQHFWPDVISLQASRYPHANLLPNSCHTALSNKQMLPCHSLLENIRWKPPGQNQDNSPSIIGTLSDLAFQPCLCSLLLNEHPCLCFCCTPCREHSSHPMHLSRPSSKLCLAFQFLDHRAWKVLPIG